MTTHDTLTEIIRENPNTRDAEIAQYILDYNMSLLDYDDWTAAERILGFPIDYEQFHTIDGTVSGLLNEYEGDPDARLLFLGALLKDYHITFDSFTRFEIFGKPALFSDSRGQLSRKIIGLSGLYAYDLRHGDDDSYPCTLEHYVAVNWFGRVFTAEPLLDDNETSRPVTDDDWSYLSDEEDLTPLQFIEQYRKEN